MAKGPNYIINVDKLTKEMEANFQKAMKRAVYTVHRELTHVLSGSRSGKMYPVPGTRNSERQGTSRGEGKKPKKVKLYRASAPGEAPASRLGDLRTSYRPIVEGRGFNAVGKVGTPLKYGPMLEHGTKKMAKRPHLSVAFELSKEKWMKEFEDLI